MTRRTARLVILAAMPDWMLVPNDDRTLIPHRCAYCGGLHYAPVPPPASNRVGAQSA